MWVPGGTIVSTQQSTKKYVIFFFQFGLEKVELLDLGRAPYVLYGVKYIDLVSLGATNLEVAAELGMEKLHDQHVQYSRQLRNVFFFFKPKKVASLTLL